MIMLISPGVTSAQSVDEVRLSLLRQIVQLLERQLELLIAEQATPAKTQVQTVDDFFQRMRQLAPDELLTTLSDTTARTINSNTDAYVRAEVDTNGNFSWQMTLNTNFLADGPSQDMIDELIVHELGHVVAFEDGLDLNDNTSCHPAVKEGRFCPDPDSYYGIFIESFWPDDTLDLLTAGSGSGVIANIPGYEDQFVSDYASVNPHEDFAESFAHYVLYEDDSYSAVEMQKVQFFDRFTQTRAIKKEILTNL